MKKLLGAERLDALGVEMRARMDNLRAHGVRNRVPEQTADSTDLA